MFSFLARLIVLLIAISVLRSVIMSVRRFLSGIQPNRGPVKFAHSREPASTTLKQDPVCGTYVAIDSSLKKVAGGHVFHFCSPECRDKFNA